MFIEEITFRNFRNYELLELRFSPNMNIIIGGNAQGKTNILEGIYFLSTAKSHRTSVDSELIQNGKEWFYLKGCVLTKDSSIVVEIANSNVEKKKIKINGKVQDKISSVIGKINTVMFSPEDLALVKGTPSERRKFLDILISRIDRVHLYNIQEYNSALKQRNELLRKIREKRKLKQDFAPYSDTLDSWNSLLVRYGTEIVQKRVSIIPELSELVKEKHGQLTLSKENIKLEYQSQLTKPNNVGDQIKDIFQKSLDKNVDIDIRFGTTTIGPHRDDLIITVDDMDIRKFGSQGQQRTAVLSLKLATIDLINQRLGEYPIILLDDVASELDEKRVSLLFDLINKIPAQTFLTTTDFHNSDMKIWLSDRKKSDLNIFIVENGCVRKENAIYKDNT